MTERSLVNPETNRISNPDLARPLSSVALHDAENICIGSGLYDAIKLHADKKVFTHYGLDLLEYLSLPHDVTAFILDDCTNRLKAEYNQTSTILDNLSATGK